jgi:hypothetical protein
VTVVDWAGLTVFDVETGATLYTKKVSTANAEIAAAALDADGKRVAFVGDRQLLVVDVDGGRERANWPLGESSMRSAALSPDGRWVATVIEQPSTTLVAPKESSSKPMDSFLLIGDVNAPSAKLARVPLGPFTARSGWGQRQLSMTNSGWIVVGFSEGRALLIDPQRSVYELSRDAKDEGLWLRAANGSVSSFGTVKASSRGLGCRLGAWMLPLEACLPSSCTR